MTSLLMVAALAMAPGAPASKAAEGPDLDGKWLIVYAEEKGRRSQNWEQKVGTFKDGALTYEKDGKELTINFKFGPHQTVKATGGKAEGGTSGESDGVYIAGQDYFCVSLSGGTFTGGEKGTSKDKDSEPKQPTAKADDTNKGNSSGDFILILRRQRSGTEK
jgi:hypothetical protein